MADLVSGGSGSLPRFPGSQGLPRLWLLGIFASHPCAPGLSQGPLRDLFGASDAALWRGVYFDMGRAPSDSKYCAVWRAPLESFAQLDRVLAPVYVTCCVPAKTSCGVAETLAELGELLRAYVDSIPEPFFRVTGARVVLVGPEGSLRPLGVVAGMVFARHARAS